MTKVVHLIKFVQQRIINYKLKSSDNKDYTKSEKSWRSPNFCLQKCAIDAPIYLSVIIFATHIRYQSVMSTEDIEISN